jgi:hypothetical protein
MLLQNLPCSWTVFIDKKKFACVAKKVAKKYKTTVYSNAQSNVLIWKSLIINHDKHLLFSDFFTLKKKLIFFFSKIAIYLSLGLHKGRPSYRRSLQHLKTWNFLTFFLFCLVIFALLDPDPRAWVNLDPIWIRNTELVIQYLSSSLEMWIFLQRRSKRRRRRSLAA